MSKPQRQRGRPQGGRLFERTDIIEASLDVLARGGYSAMTMRGVARELGASLATIQRHYATKDELWRGAVDAFIDGVEQPIFKDSTDPLVDGIVETLVSAGERPGLLTAVLCDRAPGHAERFGYLAKRLGERHKALLIEADHLRERGTLRDFDINALLLLLNVGVGAIASAPNAARHIYGFDLDDPADRDRLARALGDILRSGLRRRDA